MSAVPLILVVGGDALAVRVCEELCATQGHRTALLWMHDHDLATRMDRLGCDFHPHAPNDYDALTIAGVMDAVSIMVLTDDDRLNLQVALKARDLNPGIRVVMRQFNRTLGRKLEQNLPNCSVISLASHAAATFVATALDPSCFYALQFPDLDGVQAGFSERPAAAFGVTGLTLPEAQQRLRGRIVALRGSPVIPSNHVFSAHDLLVVFGRVESLEATSRTHLMVRGEQLAERVGRVRSAFGRVVGSLRNIDPILKWVLRIVGAELVLAILLFTFILHGDPFTATFYVLASSMTASFGDIVPSQYGHFAMIATLIVMISGVAATGIFVAFVTSALTRAQFVAMQGLRQITTRGHVIVCGSGNVGTRAIDYLRTLKQKIVVIDSAPDTTLIEASRTRKVELLTGDATQDATLDLCNVAHARAVVALTESDTANLEVALGARARNPRIPVVMRVQDEPFALSIAQQFEAVHTYSTTTLAAATFAMLSRFPGTRGRIAFGDDRYNVGERVQGEVPEPPPAEHCIPLAVWRKGTFLHIDRFDEMEPYDRLLFLVPLSQFRPAAAGHESATAAVP